MINVEVSILCKECKSALNVILTEFLGFVDSDHLSIIQLKLSYFRGIEKRQTLISWNVDFVETFLHASVHSRYCHCSAHIKGHPWPILKVIFSTILYLEYNVKKPLVSNLRPFDNEFTLPPVVTVCCRYGHFGCLA